MLVSWYNDDGNKKILHVFRRLQMIKETKLPEELIDGHDARKLTLEGIDEIQYLYVAPRTSIKPHGHDNQWEVWVRIPYKTAHVCLKGEEHELVNTSGALVVLMAIKGHLDYSYDDISEIFRRLGFTVHHGSLMVSD